MVAPNFCKNFNSYMKISLGYVVKRIKHLLLMTIDLKIWKGCYLETYTKIGAYDFLQWKQLFYRVGWNDYSRCQGFCSLLKGPCYTSNNIQLNCLFYFVFLYHSWNHAKCCLVCYYHFFRNSFTFQLIIFIYNFIFDKEKKNHKL